LFIITPFSDNTLLSQMTLRNLQMHHTT
jgi:hypothetical protein